jgi:hypothetical protein
MSVEDRRRLVSFDPEHFQKEAAAGRPTHPTDAFRRAYETNFWRGPSRSGPGASVDQTARIAEALPALMSRMGVRQILDLPCGDFSWMARVKLPRVSYVGADLLPEVIAANVERYSAPGRRFIELDLTSSPLPPADLLLCRDCLVHLSFSDAGEALRNIGRSEITYLLTTTFPDEPVNIDIVTGDWRPLDLTKPPFDLPSPLELVTEGCSEHGGAFPDKSLALWRVADISDILGSVGHHGATRRD